MSFCAHQNDIIKNFAFVMSAVVKRVDCIFRLRESSE